MLRAHSLRGYCNVKTISLQVVQKNAISQLYFVREYSCELREFERNKEESQNNYNNYHLAAISPISTYFGIDNVRSKGIFLS